MNSVEKLFLLVSFLSFVQRAGTETCLFSCRQHCMDTLLGMTYPRECSIPCSAHPLLAVAFRNNQDISARAHSLLIILQAQPVWGNNLLDHTEASHRWNISGRSCQLLRCQLVSAGDIILLFCQFNRGSVVKILCSLSNIIIIYGLCINCEKTSWSDSA